MKYKLTKYLNITFNNANALMQYAWCQFCDFKCVHTSSEATISVHIGMYILHSKEHFIQYVHVYLSISRKLCTWSRYALIQYLFNFNFQWTEYVPCFVVIRWETNPYSLRWIDISSTFWGSCRTEGCCSASEVTLKDVHEIRWGPHFQHGL